jgi:uncharacterized membrane protein YphA (DoxX/SURF4 family)
MKSFYLSLRRFAAVLIGIVFLCSGLLKLMDPVGTMLIVTEYCKFFHLAFLVPIARVLGIGLAFLESATGVALLTGVSRRVTAWITYGFLSFFTLVTFLLWWLNPEMDCGCFGEAVHLTHLQSLVKNVILLLLAVFAFTPMDKLGTPTARRQLAAWLGWVSLVAALIYCNRHIPLVDFTAFAPGAELFASQEDFQPQDGFRPAYIYEKDGHQSSFTLDNLPDSTWTFVRPDTLSRETPVRRKEHPILSFSDAEGNYQDDLAVQDKAVVISVYNPAKAPWSKIVERYLSVQEAGARPLLLITSTPEAAAALPLPAGVTPYFADYKTLITLNRDNGGVSYFVDGELIAKWGVRDFPKDIQTKLEADPVDLSTHESTKKRIQSQGFCLYLGAVLILL